MIDYRLTNMGGRTTSENPGLRLPLHRQGKTTDRTEIPDERTEPEIQTT